MYRILCWTTFHYTGHRLKNRFKIAVEKYLKVYSLPILNIYILYLKKIKEKYCVFGLKLVPIRIFLR